MDFAGHAESAWRAQRANALAAIAVGLELGVVAGEDRDGACRVQRRGTPLPAIRRSRACRRRRRIHGHRRLRAPPCRNGGHARGGARRFSGPAARARFPAASLHAHARLLRGFRESAFDRRRARARPRSIPQARRRSSPPMAGRLRERCACRARSSRSSSRQVAEVPAAIRAAARDGDVVLTMGAGSIGGVPAMLAKSQEKERTR